MKRHTLFRTGFLVIFWLHSVLVNAEVVLAHRAKVSALVSGFEDTLFDNGTYYELFFLLDPDDSVSTPCNGNHPAGIDGLWVFSPGTAENPLHSRQLFSLLHTASITGMPISLLGESDASCAGPAIQGVILHQRNI